MGSDRNDLCHVVRAFGSIVLRAMGHRAAQSFVADTVFGNYIETKCGGHTVPARPKKESAGTK
jgi:hypothetical protein